MQPNLYQNQLLAGGLSSLVKSFIGDPQEVARSEMMASEAALNNGTVKYREDIGTAGRSNNLGDMLVASLQAGQDYSKEAPEIVSAMASLPSSGMSAREMANIQVGTGVQSARNTFPGLSQVLNKSGRSGGGGGGGGARPAKIKPLTAGARSLILKSLPEDTDPAVALSYVEAAEKMLATNTENEALSAVLGNLNMQEVVTDENNSWLNPMDWLRGPETQETLQPYAQSAPAPTSSNPASAPVVAPTLGDAVEMRIPEAAINALIGNPGLAAQFEQKYGAGTASQYIRMR